MYAASTRLGYPVKFTYLPHLTKLDKPRPDLSSIATALHLAPSPPPSDSPSSDPSHGSVDLPTGSCLLRTATPAKRPGDDKDGEGEEGNNGEGGGGGGGDDDDDEGVRRKIDASNLLEHYQNISNTQDTS